MEKLAGDPLLGLKFVKKLSVLMLYVPVFTLTFGSSTLLGHHIVVY